MDILRQIKDAAHQLAEGEPELQLRYDFRKDAWMFSGSVLAVGTPLGRAYRNSVNLDSLVQLLRLEMSPTCLVPTVTSEMVEGLR